MLRLIEYDPVTGKKIHRYDDDERPGIIWDSVSKVTKAYEGPFTGSPEASYHNPRSAWYMYQGGVEAVRAAWEKAAEDGKSNGTKMHNAILEYYQDGVVAPGREEQLIGLDRMYEWVYSRRKFQSGMLKMYHEVPQGLTSANDPTWGLAGTPDNFVCEVYAPSKVYVDIFDYKQDKFQKDGVAIAFDSKYANQRMKAPLNMMGANGNVYSLKMWCYWIMIRFGLKAQGIEATLRTMYLFHWTGTGWVAHPCTDQFENAKLMLKDWFSKPANKVACEYGQMDDTDKAYLQDSLKSK